MIYASLNIDNKLPEETIPRFNLCDMDIDKAAKVANSLLNSCTIEEFKIAIRLFILIKNKQL